MDWPQITAVLHQIGTPGCECSGILTSFPIASLMVSFLNNVRVKVKEACEEQYLAAVEAWSCPEGMTDRYIAKTGERRYCFVGHWESEEKLVVARPQMSKHLESVRELLDEITPELGITDPVSGPVLIHSILP